MNHAPENPANIGYAKIPDIHLEMSDEEIANRKLWLGLGPEDENNIAHLDKLISQNVDQLLDYLYDHFLAHDDTSSFFPNQEVLNRAKAGQRNYFLKLTCGKYDREYVNDRLTVGKTHYRIGLDTRWYLGAYYRALTFLRRLIFEEFKDNPELADRISVSLTKLIFFDMGLAIDTYNAAKIQAIRDHKDLISKLETERTVTKSIVENAPIGIVRLSTEFVCLEANSEFISFIGGTGDTIIGRSIFALCPDLPQHDFEEALREGLAKQATAAKLNFFGSDHDSFYDWSVWPVSERDESVSGLVATFTLVTDSVRLQQQREDFVATLTHDLKTPIIAANRALKLLMEGDFGPVQDSQKSIIETILQSNNSMYQMVVTLLDVYKYDSGVKQLTLIPTNLATAVEAIVNELSTLAKQKQIELAFASSEDNIPVLCDIDEIRRVLQNLIDNSLKYTPSTGSISVKLSQDEGTTTVSVTDTGKGISEADKPKLFQRFWQASSGGRYYASTGLGLYLCSKIVESHGGRIWCESEIGKGSKFAFTLNNVNLTSMSH
jgi:signal transduction histidine kinase